MKCNRNARPFDNVLLCLMSAKIQRQRCWWMRVTFRSEDAMCDCGNIHRRCASLVLLDNNIIIAWNVKHVRVRVECVRKCAAASAFLSELYSMSNINAQQFCRCSICMRILFVGLGRRLLHTQHTVQPARWVINAKQFYLPAHSVLCVCMCVWRSIKCKWMEFCPCFWYHQEHSLCAIFFFLAIIILSNTKFALAFIHLTRARLLTNCKTSSCYPACR